MKYDIKKLLPASLVALATAHAGMVPLREHVDVNWDYDVIDGWISEAKTPAAGDDVFREFDTVFLPLDDRPTSSGGQRGTQPSGAQYAFTGVAPGAPIWIAPQFQTPGQCWVGFNNYQSNGVFGKYQETDSRLAGEEQAIALPWIRIAFQGLTYLGNGIPTFSMWQTDFSGNPTVWFSTTDATTPDVFLMVAGSHTHANWGFGAEGIYRIRLSASAYTGPGATNPTGPSAPATLTFAVGPVAQWQATYFSGPELDSAMISGLAADPDRDGMTNLEEYAFGLDPRSGSRLPISAGLGLPIFSTERNGTSLYHVLEFPRRKAEDLNSPPLYTAEFSNLSSAWLPATEETISAISGTQTALNGVWEKVRARRLAIAGAERSGFGRLRLVRD